MTYDATSEERCRLSSNTPSPEMNDHIARSDDEIEQDVTGGESEAGLPPVCVSFQIKKLREF